MAHDMWLEVRDYTPEPGEEINIVIAYDHHFPTREFMNPNDLEEIFLCNNKGDKTGFNNFSEVELKTQKPLKTAGTYIVAAKNKGGFFSKTTEGYKKGYTKKDLKDVISCGYYAKYSKAVVNAGKPGGSAFLNPIGHDLEIIPMSDPGTLKQGEFLPIKVLLKGNPLPSSLVTATYIGFSTDKNTFAYATKTDKKGTANIKMLNSGIWLITTSYMEDYPDAKICDEQKLSASLTFEIR